MQDGQAPNMSMTGESKAKYTRNKSSKLAVIQQTEPVLRQHKTSF
jgi:hypothetical protein